MLGLCVAMVDGGNFVVALVCIVSYGIANGLKAVQRATLPLACSAAASSAPTWEGLPSPRASSRPPPHPVIAAVLTATAVRGRPPYG